ncbi:undecaprenyldiphospho-muramoylpentapeptide beta-N-acetylglucosaminyltransferase [Flavihumibacter petaseus]|uniref:UDP-N-acetylglucosamine--N-acetylmuramyl-(pentapeptide) pyrophosphoryl-undecaprenol N-acetylglucosamine transferase n=1 Tax=Flavihumibacter petaseus NBRC 106054 TaxID=1220578 RepID=A0A0E9N5J7_9BACT|nr:undecaprenyldiphospho-muramoylpentapeptide beta-N-acetylglucosaminyltransferase [Flavihumibacter petaseus]GAO44956.1 UDP-N-acetylglucosamine--N-acetylmuramyl-(pentapeptide) pyrophosphoryl-undecaprenol N-acetylglucosamine transferase [Flavihumibacter petaseus NBRC 106054]
MTQKKIIIAGGGTGGHIFPAIAIANALKQQYPAVEILFVGAKGKMEMEKVPQAGYRIVGLDIAGFNRSSLIKNIGLPFKLIKSFFQVRRIFRNFPPDAVVGVGGYSSFPVLRLAQQRNIPSFLHESNSFAGKANQMLGRKASLVFVSGNGMEKFFPANRIRVSGNPVRTNIVQLPADRESAIRSFGLDPAKTTVLVVGGSLGAKSINDAIGAGLQQLLQSNLQLIWQLGKGNLTVEREKLSQSGVCLKEFIPDMERAYAAADIIVSRAGAMAIAEIAVVQKPSILVPYPYAAEDHQTVNAMALVKQNAAIMVKDNEVQQRLTDTIIALAGDPLQQKALKQNITPLGVSNADAVIAAEILKQIGIVIS